jgi:hypothetical protein
MRSLPRAAQAFWLLIVLSASLVAANAFLSAPSQPMDWAAVALYGAAGTIAQSFRIRLPHARRQHGETTSVAMAVNVAASLVLPVAAAIMVAPIGWIVSRFFSRGINWHKPVFNVGQAVLSVAAAGTVWHTFGGQAGLVDSPASVGWMLVAVAAYFSVNTGSVALMVALVERLPVHHIWLRGHRRLMPSYFAVMSAGVLGAYLWSTAPSSVVLLVIPLIAIYYSFKRTVELEEQTMSALFDLADMMDKRDYYTHRHSLRVGEYAERLAIYLGLAADQARLLYLCGRLHDVGKCVVDNEVLLKPGPLDEEERRHIMRHADVGGGMLAHFGLFRDGAAYVRGHHERWDGTGYPDGLRGEAIPFGARLIAVVDSYDAMTSTRPYRAALPHDEAVRRLRAGAGLQWDPRIVDAFLRMWQQRPAVMAHLAAAGAPEGEASVSAARP